MSGFASEIHRIGIEGQPVAVVDGFHPDPDALRDQAAGTAFGPALHHYPGIRAPLPADYFDRIAPALRAGIAQAFDHGGTTRVIDASFAIVTTPPDRLSVAQRLPHMDAADLLRVAFVHHLHVDDRSGTAFYRHRATGFETIDRSRAAIYHDQLDAELRHGGEPAPGYIAGSTPLFERLASVDAQYNRAIIYRSALLHSGLIGDATTLVADPLTGRLTITGFLSLI